MKKTNLIVCTSLFLATVSASAAPPRTPTLEVSARELARLPAREPGAQPADYRARLSTLRLFGTQGEGSAASATLADTASWETRTYTVGQQLGRSLTLASVTADSVEILDATTGARISVRVGAEVRVRLIEHAFDFAAMDHGQHQWSVRAAAMARILERYGVGASGRKTALHGAQLVRLSVVQPQSALSRIGLQEGDLLVSVNGEPATEESPAAIAAALTRASTQVLLLTLVRRGTRYEIAYAID